MSFLFQQNSIRNKFSLVIILACGAVLLAVSLLFGSIEYISFRNKAASELETLAAVMGESLSRPLMAGDDLQANATLSALSAEHNPLAAYLFNGHDKPFAQYLSSRYIHLVEESVRHDFAGGFPAQWRGVEAPVSHFGLHHLSLFLPIYYQGKKIGGLYLVSDLSDLNQRLIGLLFTVLLAGGTVVGLAWALSDWLQKPISRPLFELVGKMYEVSQTGNYRLRATRYSDDEIGQLVDGFNDMLTQIEIRDQKIDAHQKGLELTVRERTAELSAAVEQLETAKQAAEAANQAKSAFLANITHELRTPLVGVLGMNELLVESGLDKRQLPLAEAVQRSGEELLELINEILDFSRIEGGHLKLKPEKVNLLKLVEETLVVLADRAFAKGLDLICRVEPDAVWVVEADPLRLKQMLLNLLGNAIKFTPQGYVELRLRTVTSGNFRFEIEDSGIGIDAQSQESIFEAFSQVDDSPARVFGGTGLGLSIVRELTRLMDGHLAVQSEPGQGALFALELPLPRITAAFECLPAEHHGCSVILFEPGERLRAAILKMLNDLGYSATAVASTAELSDLLAETRTGTTSFDLAILSADVEAVEPQLLDRIESCCGAVMQLGKRLPSDHSLSTSVVIHRPLLWSHLLQPDLLAVSPERSRGMAPNEQSGSVEASVAPPSLATNRILVVDDNASTRELITLSLLGSKWSSDEAKNAEEALAAVSGGSYGLILMDINMPGIDGLTATRSIRALGVMAPIIALTAHGDEKVFSDCLEAGMQGVLRKPFRQRELFATLDEWAGSAHSPRPQAGEGDG